LRNKEEAPRNTERGFFQVLGPPGTLCAMDSLHATIEEFAAEGFTHVQCYCPRCRMMRLRPISWLPGASRLGIEARCGYAGLIPMNEAYLPWITGAFGLIGERLSTHGHRKQIIAPL
jgi:hypothetical protein